MKELRKAVNEYREEHFKIYRMKEKASKFNFGDLHSLTTALKRRNNPMKTDCQDIDSKTKYNRIR